MTPTAHAPTAPTASPDQLTPDELRSLYRLHRAGKGPLLIAASEGRHPKAGHYFTALTIEPAHPSALWTAEHRKTKHGKPYVRHVIRIGENAPASFLPKVKAAKRKRLQALRALLYHEAAHAAYSATNLADLAKLARRCGIPWRLVNIHEDIRIEAAYSAALKIRGTDSPFTWREYYAPEPTNTPAAYLLALNLIGPTCLHTLPLADAEWIRDHYAKTADAAQTPDTRAAILRAIEFARKFPSTALPEPARGEPAPLGDDGTPEGDEITTPAPDAEQTLKEETGHVPENNGSPHQHQKEPAPTTPQTEVSRKWGSIAATFARRSSGAPPALANVPRLAQTLADIARRGDRLPQRLSVSGPRIHLPALAAQSEAPFRAISPARGRAEITLVMDMSGSMGDVFRVHGAAFLGAMLALSRQGVFTLHPWLTQEGFAWRIPPTLAPSELANFAATGSGEGLHATFRAAAADMARSRFVFCYTDGQLSDTPSALTRQAIGLLTCSASATGYFADQLRPHFSTFRIAETAHQLAREAVRIATK